jgi:hypothetical protein
MIAHTFGYVTVILLQQVVILGLIWSVVHLLDRSRRERRRYSSALLFSDVSASNDLAALAVQLAKTADGNTQPVPLRTRVRITREERV